MVIVDDHAPRIQTVGRLGSKGTEWAGAHLPPAQVFAQEPTRTETHMLA